ncbi:MAG: hypothetical protein RLZZ543_2144 [Bacteroidota bacterium]|jgi:uncharacterized protein
MEKNAKQELIPLTEQFVQNELKDAEAGHDWLHIQRVRANALEIAQHEKANLLIVELAALLHDVADAKFHQGDEEIGPRKAQEFLLSIGAEDAVIDEVLAIMKHISFKGGHNQGSYSSPEFFIVQDADRLDAIGAIGIARTFHYGGFRNNPIYHPDIQPKLNMTREEYKAGNNPTINHFYEKLLLLKDRMNTATGKKMAAQRHAFMEQFLSQFFLETEGKR